jgi:hypothetical protein
MREKDAQELILSENFIEKIQFQPYMVNQGLFLANSTSV